ncbi:MAG: amidohydrolase [Alphaproteobacteria bacterium]|nr:amidohydrolase [Alphaproteobacteria bacterium]
MSNYNFLKWILIPLLSTILTSCLKQKIELIIYNAKIYSVDEQFNDYSAIAVSNGKILDLGNPSDILNKYNSSQKIDLQGAFIYPGFFDGHTHFTEYARNLFEVNLYGSTSWNEVLTRVQNFYNQHPKITFIKGFGWDQNNWKDKKLPNNSKLNQLFTNIPVILTRIDGHALIANDYALNLAHIYANQTIEGGIIDVNEGVLSGLLIDRAQNLIDPILPKETYQEFVKKVQVAEKNCVAYGLTALTICGIDYAELMWLDSMYNQNLLKIKLHILLSDKPQNFEFLAKRGIIKTNHYQVTGFKVYGDGALGSRGACLKKPYKDDDGNYGFLLFPYYHYDSLAEVFSETNFQLCTHAIGDSTNHVVLEIYNKYLQPNNDKRWRIEHAQIVDSPDLNLFGSVAVIPSVQPRHAIEDMFWAQDRLGSKRMVGAYSFKSLLNQNSWIVLGTDFPAGVGDPSPFKTYLAAVFRKNANLQPESGFRIQEALTPKEALYGMTFWPAKGAFWEKDLGSLKIGKSADFIILDQDLLATKDSQVLKINVKATYINGEKVY